MGVDRPDGSWTARNLIFFEGKSARCGASLDPSTHEITLQPGFYVLEGFGVGREVDSFELAFSLWRTEYEPLRLRAHRLGFRGSASPSRTPWRTSRLPKSRLRRRRRFASSSGTGNTQTGTGSGGTTTTLWWTARSPGAGRGIYPSRSSGSNGCRGSEIVFESIVIADGVFDSIDPAKKKLSRDIPSASIHELAAPRPLRAVRFVSPGSGELKRAVQRV